LYFIDLRHKVEENTGMQVFCKKLDRNIYVFIFTPSLPVKRYHSEQNMEAVQDERFEFFTVAERPKMAENFLNFDAIFNKK